MTKLRSSLFLGVTCMMLFACTKTITQQSETCVQLYKVPLNGYNISNNLFAGSTFTEPVCGILPLHKNNYWVYRDSVFDYLTGAFQNVFIDTLRFQEAYVYTDTITWWKPIVPIHPTGGGYYNKGFYDRVYSTDSVLYSLNEGIFQYKNSIKWFFQLTADSINNSSRWNDTDWLYAYGKKHNDPVAVPAGIFNGCTFYEKKAGNYYAFILNTYFKPGIGVLKSYEYYYQMPSQPLVLTRSSELLSYHFE